MKIFTNKKFKEHEDKYKKLIIKKNKEIDKLENQLDMVSDMYLKLREKFYEKELNQKEWNQKYGE